MNPEKEIVSWWLHKQGFFTISSIKAPHNREIDILAIKIDDGTLESVWHVESAISVASIDNVKPQEYKQRFDDKSIQKRVKEALKNHLGRVTSYKKVLVVGATSNLSEFKRLEGIDVIEFGDVISEVILKLDKQNYRNITLRTMQLLKYLALSEPARLAALLSDSSSQKILKLGTREKFIRYMLQDSENLRILAKPEYEEKIVRILASSSLRAPERLASVVHHSILTKQSRKRFLESTLELNNVMVNEDMKTELEQVKEKPLQDYM